MSVDALREQFVSHVNDWGYSYGTKEEFEFRFERYLLAEKDIQEHNAKDMGFKLGHNQFSTWTDAEYKRLLGSRRTNEADRAPYAEFDESLTAATVDWRT